MPSHTVTWYRLCASRLVTKESLMQRYFLSKVGQSILLLFGGVLLVFMMVRITGDPAALMMPREAGRPCPWR